MNSHLSDLRDMEVWVATDPTLDYRYNPPHPKFQLVSKCRGSLDIGKGKILEGLPPVWRFHLKGKFHDQGICDEIQMAFDYGQKLPWSITVPGVALFSGEARINRLGDLYQIGDTSFFSLGLTMPMKKDYKLMPLFINPFTSVIKTDIMS